MSITRATALTGAAMVVLAGCGGSSNKQLSYSDFISKTNVICKQAEADAGKATSPQSAAAAIEPSFKKLKALKPPDALKPAYDQFVSLADQTQAFLKKGDATSANALNPQSNQAATEMGTKDCLSQG